MFRQSVVNLFAMVAAFVLGAWVMGRPPGVSAQVAGGHGKCVGVTAVGQVQVYRAFEDGTVEMNSLNSQGTFAKWQPIVK
jgi:hypothetical protein